MHTERMLIGHKVLKYLFVLLACCYAQCQSKETGARIPHTQFATSGAEAALSEMLLKNLGEHPGQNSTGVVKGSPFLDEALTRGKVYYKGAIADTFYMRYDAYRDELQLKKNHNGMEPFKVLLKNGDISTIYQGKPLNFLRFYNRKGTLQKGYLFQLVQGRKYNVYLRRTKKLRMGKKSTNSLAQNIAYRYITKTDYYIATPITPGIVWLPRSKHKILRFLDDEDRETVKNSVRLFPLNATREARFTQLVNTLQGN